MRRLVTFILAIALFLGTPVPISESNFSRKLLPAQRPEPTSEICFESRCERFSRPREARRGSDSTSYRDEDKRSGARKYPQPEGIKPILHDRFFASPSSASSTASSSLIAPHKIGKYRGRRYFRDGFQIILMKVTAYDPNCPICTGRWCKYGKTSTGANAQEFNGVAADLELLPKGTRLYIPGVGDRVVDDTGGAMRRSARHGVHHIDLRVKSHSEAEEFGVQWKEVEVFE